MISTIAFLSYDNGSPEVFSQLCELVELESQCCQFLTFKLIVAPQQRIALEVSAVIADFFGA
jgi:hypothetical protein